MTNPTTDQQLWEEALIACGYWKPNEKCNRRDIDGHCGIHPHKTGKHGWEWHDIPAPTLNDAGAVLAMLLWGWRQDRWFLTELSVNLGPITDHTPHEGKAFSIALARAVLAVKGAK